MYILHVLYRNGIWISLPLFGVGVYLLWYSIMHVVKLGNKNLIVDAPLVAEQDVTFEEAGQVILSVEGPFLTTRFGNISFELIGGEGVPMQGQTCWLRSRSTSMKGRVRLQLYSFEIGYPGHYSLLVKGLGAPRPDDVEHRIIFMKPHLLQTVSYIIGIVLGGFLTIGSMVLFISRVVAKGDIP